MYITEYQDKKAIVSYSKDLTRMNKILFLLAFLIGYTVQAITGFAGNLFVMPVGVNTIGLTSSVSVLNAMGVFACGLLALTNIQYVNWREFLKMASVMLVFMLIGIWLDTILPLDFLIKIYALIIIYVGAKNFFFPGGKNLPSAILFLVLALAGLIQGMFVSGGAFLVIYATQRLKDKQEFRITISLVWTVLNCVYAIIAFQAGHFTGDVWQLVLICVPIAVLATFVGNYIGKRISQELFLRIVFCLLMFMGAALFITG